MDTRKEIFEIVKPISTQNEVPSDAEIKTAVEKILELFKTESGESTEPMTEPPPIPPRPPISTEPIGEPIGKIPSGEYFTPSEQQLNDPLLCFCPKCRSLRGG